MGFADQKVPRWKSAKVQSQVLHKGDKQVDEVDYFDKYSPVVSWSTVCMLLVMSINLGWHTRQVDFSNAFVQAELQEDVYITMPQHFTSDEGLTSTEAVLKLNKSLYGLVQAPMYWFNHLSSVLKQKGFKPSAHDQCLFFGQGFMVLVCIDNCLFFGPDLNKINEFICELEEHMA